MKTYFHTTKTFILKLLAFWVLFLIFHFGYEWLPSPIVAAFAGTSEGAVQHMKMAFWAYTFASLGEYFLRKVAPGSRLRFFDSRLLITNLAPWSMFFWYILPVFMGKPFATEFMEILAANIILVLAGIALLILESSYSSLTLTRAARTVLIIFWLLAGFLLVAVSFITPWAGFFIA